MISPYQQNIDILKGFFKKPIVIALSAGTFVSVLVGIILSFFNIYGNLGEQAVDYFLDRLPEGVDVSRTFVSTGGSSGSNLDIMAILFAVVFLLFYVLSRKQENKLGVPSIMFKVISIIVVVSAGLLLGVVLLVFLLLLASAPVIDSVMEGFTSMFIPLYIFLAIFMVVYLLSAISQLIFSLSIRKSLTSIYLKRTGAMFYGVMSIITAAFGVAMLIFFLIFLSNVPFFKMNDVQITVMCVTSAISVCNSVLAGILAMQYSTYIKNISQKFRVEYPSEPAVNEQPAVQTAPVQEFPQQIPVQQNFVPPAPTIQNQQPYAEPVQEQNPFETAPVQPQPAPVEPPQAPINPETQAYAQSPVQPAPIQEQPITQAPPQQAPDLHTPRFCTQCGKPVGADDYFCNNCGTKIIRN